MLFYIAAIAVSCLGFSLAELIIKNINPHFFGR